jgi:integrase
VWRESRNPATGIVLPKAVKDTADEIGEPIDPAMVPSQSEVDALVAAAYEHRELFGLLVEVAAVSGLRFGELAALTKADWDPTGRLLVVTKTLVEAGKGDLTFIGVPKSRASRRRVLVPVDVAAKLDERVSALDADDLIFTSERGRRLRHSNVMKREFHPVAAAAGFPARFKLHSLRHHAISNWFDEGRRAATVAKLAGHSSERFTLDRYYGARNDFLEELRQLGF